MNSSPETRESLLLRVRDHGDTDAWLEFEAVYRPMIYRLARRRGLQESDADDLAQRVLISVSRSLVDWEKDPSRGSFRGWLSRVVQNAIINMVTRAPKDVGLGGSDFLDLCQRVTGAESDVEQLIRREHQRCLLRLAAGRVQRQINPKTWQAFWRTTIDGRSPEEVAQELGLSVGAVYGARSRVMRQLQSVAASLREHQAWED